MGYKQHMLETFWHGVCSLVLVHLSVSLPKVLFCIVVSIPTCFSDFCKPSWTQSATSQTCVKKFEQPSTWIEATNACLNKEGQLVKIGNEAMNDFIADFLKPSDLPFWVGLNDRDLEGHFKWLTPDGKVNYTNWASEEPKSMSDPLCVQINSNWGKATKSWIDDYCSVKAAFICEKKKDSCLLPWLHIQRFDICINAIEKRQTWFAAEETCKNNKGHLVTIKNGAMNDIITHFVSSSSSIFWIGLIDETQDGQFKWVASNQRTKYVRWAPLKPNNYANASNCVQINKRRNKSWINVDCGQKANFICERDLDCDDMRYGSQCSLSCNINCKQGHNKTCHTRTGECLNGCKDGFVGNQCESKCDDMTYGSQCLLGCSITCKLGNNGTCDHINGTCLNGCNAGFKGEHCELTCEENTFGENCNRACSNCKVPENGSLCDRIYGVCFGGCKPGYHEFDCSSECENGTFGEGCKNFCSLNCNGTGRLCHHENGICLHGCKSSFTGLKCHETKSIDSITDLYLIGFYGLVMAVPILAVITMLLLPMILLEKKQVSMPEEQPHKSSTKHFLILEDESYINLDEMTQSEIHFEKKETKESLYPAPSKENT